MNGETPGSGETAADTWPPTTSVNCGAAHGALAMTTPFAAGDEGWIYRDQMAGVRVGAVIVEIRAADGAQGLPEFTRSYADFVRETLQRGGPGWWERRRSGRGT